MQVLFCFAKKLTPIMRKEESYVGDGYCPVWKGNCTLLQQHSRTRVFSFLFYISETHKPNKGCVLEEYSLNNQIML